MKKILETITIAILFCIVMYDIHIAKNIFDLLKIVCYGGLGFVVGRLIFLIHFDKY